jgi:hypothetical protein
MDIEQYSDFNIHGVGPTDESAAEDFIKRFNDNFLGRKFQDLILRSPLRRWTEKSFDVAGDQFFYHARFNFRIPVENYVPTDKVSNNEKSFGLPEDIINGY